MPQPRWARSIITTDGRSRVMYTWDWPDNVRAPYFDYAVTVLDESMLAHYHAEAMESRINWYGFQDYPGNKWL